MRSWECKGQWVICCSSQNVFAKQVCFLWGNARTFAFSFDSRPLKKNALSIFKTWRPPFKKWVGCEALKNSEMEHWLGGFLSWPKLFFRFSWTKEEASRNLDYKLKDTTSWETWCMSWQTIKRPEESLAVFVDGKSSYEKWAAKLLIQVLCPFLTQI